MKKRKYATNMVLQIWNSKRTYRNPPKSNDDMIKKIMIVNRYKGEIKEGDKPQKEKK